MDWKFKSTASWTLIGSTLCLGGCLTPGYQLREAPGFTATFQAYDRGWQAMDRFSPGDLSQSFDEEFLLNKELGHEHLQPDQMRVGHVLPAAFEGDEVHSQVESSRGASGDENIDAIQHADYMHSSD